MEMEKMGEVMRLLEQAKSVKGVGMKTWMGCNE